MDTNRFNVLLCFCLFAFVLFVAMKQRLLAISGCRVMTVCPVPQKMASSHQPRRYHYLDSLKACDSHRRHWEQRAPGQWHWAACITVDQADHLLMMHAYAR